MARGYVALRFRGGVVHTKLRKSVTLSMDPFSSKSLLKKFAVSIFTPMAANTMAKLSSLPS